MNPEAKAGVDNSRCYLFIENVGGSNPRVFQGLAHNVGFLRAMEGPRDK
jgi:hypothetical protein